jgi:hypothetical protein
MADTWIVDMGAFLDLENLSLVETPRDRRMAEYFETIRVEAQAKTPGVEAPTRLKCWRRPGRKPCVGHVRARLQDVPSEIHWRCPKCLDNGILKNWRARRPLLLPKTEPSR